jgi:hypothetical protein
MDEAIDRTSTASVSMSLEEARAVMWLRSNYKPLGQLLDEGFLNRQRLEWAARNAYSPKLQQAAAVLLAAQDEAAPAAPPSDAAAPESPGSVVEVGMTMDAARATLWPFAPDRGRAIGELVDARRLTLKDLGYAIENAWDPQVREAAIVMSALRMNQVIREPAPQAGPLKVISGDGNYAARKQYQLAIVQGAILGAIFAFAVLSTLWALLIRERPAPGRPLSELLASPEDWIALVFVVLLMGLSFVLPYFLLDRVITRLDREIESYRKGNEGEVRAVDAMRQALDGRWTLFRNVVLPGSSCADLDAVLVGPVGVWALEIKTLSGEYRNIGERWEYRAGNDWKLAKAGPSRQARNNASILGNWFKADGVRQWVTPAVVWANSGSLVRVENPSVAVWTLDRLPEEVGNLWQDKEIAEETRAVIVRKLTLLCRNGEQSDG